MSFHPSDTAAFLARHGWSDAAAVALPADFSTRRYARLTKTSGATAILMEADEDQKTPQFIAVAEILRDTGVHAPEIFAAEAEKGLVLMQDFGARNVGAILDAGEPSRPYYLRAAEVLARLHRGLKMTEAEKAALPAYDTPLFIMQAELFLDAYVPFAEKRVSSENERRDFRAAWQAAFKPVESLPKSLLLRDFMPDNLMDLDSGGLGVLDFQDAGIGAIAYDLSSLCEEVRRNGGYALLPDVLAYYREMTESKISQKDMMQCCAVLSAQRHMRVLGIVARLAEKGRTEKLAFIPRIKHHLLHVLKEPALKPVRSWATEYASASL